MKELVKTALQAFMEKYSSEDEESTEGTSKENWQKGSNVWDKVLALKRTPHLHALPDKVWFKTKFVASLE